MDIRFNGKPIPIREGDTVASALYRAGQRIFTRSFKYHRPRGLLCCSGHCPNCLMNVDGIPNIRTCITPARAGMAVKHQNARPSLDFDYLAIAQKFDWMMPVGWYYKNFTNPRMWHLAESQIRKVAGLGDPPPPDALEAVYEHSHMQAGVAVIGGGPAGLNAAREAASQGERVVVVDDQPRTTPGDSSYTLLSRSYCFGLYEGNLLGVLQSEPHSGARERLVHIRAKRIIVATGAYEAPLTFKNNDLPGIMLSTAVWRLMHRHGIQPGTSAVIISNETGDSAIAAELRNVGITVIATVPPSEVMEATGGQHVTGLRTRRGNFACDLVVMCGQRIPDAGLLSQAGAKLEWSEQAGAFLPTELPPNITAVGDVANAPVRAASTLVSTPNKRTFVCFCNDVTTQDLRDSVAEGFDHIELLKRYTTTTMGPCQGRMCQLQAIGICARETGRGMQETGVTTSRPPNPGVTLGALGGARHHPIRRTPMHYQHEDLGAVWMDMGDWKRPRYYKSVQTERESILREYNAVRQAVGIIDVSTLGKLSLKGRDCGKLLDKVYTNRFSDLKPGRVRYAVLCDEAGIMLDDGTISRLADESVCPTSDFFITTTTGNLDFVEQWLEWWLAGGGWDVQVNNLTPALAAVNLAGPKARDVLGALTTCDLSNQAFPYMACRNAEVAGVPALLMRIGFVGETGWEIHYPAESGEHLWSALMEAGRPFGICPFGVEAQRLLRLEKRHVIVGVDTDSLTSPYEAGMAWVVKHDKEDFIGKFALGKLAGVPRQQSLVGFTMNANEIPEDGAAILVNGALAGRVTSARYSPAVEKAIGLAWVTSGAAAEGAEIEIRVAGTPVRATVTQHVFYDPEGARLRM